MAILPRRNGGFARFLVRIMSREHGKSDFFRSEKTRFYRRWFCIAAFLLYAKKWQCLGPKPHKCGFGPVAVKNLVR